MHLKRIGTHCENVNYEYNEMFRNINLVTSEVIYLIRSNEALLNSNQISHYIIHVQRNYVIISGRKNRN